MIRAVVRRVSRAIQRKALERRAREWGEHIERLDQQQRNHAGNMDLAVTELQKVKREIAALDFPISAITHAPGRTMLVMGHGRDAYSVRTVSGMRRTAEAPKA